MNCVTDIRDMPLDTWNGEDGNDGLLANGKPLTNVAIDWKTLIANEDRLLTTTGPTGAIYVPFKRTIKLGTVGHDVFAVKRANTVAGHGVWGQWGTRPRLFGPFAVKNIKLFQGDKGLTKDGVYGLYTHRKMAPYFDAYGRWLLGQTAVLSPEDLKRQKIVSTAMHGYANRYGIHYTQGWMRMSGVRQRIKPPGYPRYEDCSSFATWCYWVAGMADPNGLGYNGYGFTGTLANRGRKTSIAFAKPGDLIFYGSYPYNHVTIYVGNGRCVSHGSEIGPLLLPYNYRIVNHIRTYF